VTVIIIEIYNALMHYTFTHLNIIMPTVIISLVNLRILTTMCGIDIIMVL